ncbi:class I SAM-dependent methyltransferase [Haloprofundus salilacus]|uniref:class I SAM-dependent methyltransferase n=1 Tax=Haloprofundus salilacus TaxID=2876190 RepID=UPI001CCECF3B|nr:methyltransferase domain-containing protein [Haloprofundus salilacus]
MGFHTYDVDRADALEDESRYRHLSAEELLAALRPHPEMTVADLGSGTGFYTDDVAPHVGHLYAVDVQEAMHDIYREKGLPETVETVVADVASLPFGDDDLDAAFSTMTYHEFASAESLAELARVLRPGGCVVVVDWSKTGDGADGPPTDERYGVSDAASSLEDAGFAVDRAESRLETFLCIASV